MTREMFVQVAATAIRRTAGKPPELQAEAVTAAMEAVLAALGETGGPVTSQPAAAPPAFPSPNPAAVAVAPEPVVEPDRATIHTNSGSAYAEGGIPLIIPATRIPDSGEIGKLRAPAGETGTLRAPAAPPAEPVRSLRPSGRMKVEELSRMIQERTPLRLDFNVQMEDGSAQPMTFQRNVVSMHAHDSVKLIYGPTNALPSAREAVEVEASIHIDDLPIDLSVVLQRLAQQASELCRPRRIPQSVMPPTTAGPVQHAADTYRDPSLSAQTQGVFNSIG